VVLAGGAQVVLADAAQVMLAGGDAGPAAAKQHLKVSVRDGRPLSDPPSAETEEESENYRPCGAINHRAFFIGNYHFICTAETVRNSRSSPHA